ncbi:DUF4097 domain-containing protein [Treponema sp. TIM-1]|uniref:DUF4097 family beta strand repeat-containing protein n=1 Tax=Treponema sp. TIM-1 TaxID=2898417 RepID=UPI0039817F1C
MTKMLLKIRKAGVILFLVMAGAWTGYAAEDLPLVNTQTMGLGGIDTLSISYGSGEVILRESETGDLIIKEYMKIDRPRYYMNISRSGGTITVRQGRRPWFDWRWEARAEIYLPNSFRENIRISNASGNFRAEMDLVDYKTIDINVGSGSVSFNRLSAETLSVRVSSGDLDIRNAEGNSFISLSSGRLQIGGLSGSDHRLKTSSGRMRIDTLQGTSVIELSSGSLSIENFSGEGSFGLSSGSATITMEELTGDLRLRLSSGHIILNIPRDISFNLDAVTNSGSIQVAGDEPAQVSGNSTILRPFGPSPERTIYARTSSGNVTINRR